MKLVLNGNYLKSLVLNLFRRRRIFFTCFFLCLAVYGLARFLETIPPKWEGGGRSEFNGKTASYLAVKEYLQRLHDIKVNRGEIDGESGDKIQPLNVLEDLFIKADENHDGYLNAEEISKWINAKTHEHIHGAIVENYKVFTAIDVRPKNGLISWNEYHVYFLKENGLNETYITDHSEKHKELTRNVKETIMRDKAAWSECAKTAPDHLNLDEFLSFRHPESSYSATISIVDEIYKKFDRDGDEILTEDEFSVFQTDYENEISEPFNHEEKTRRIEFREAIDLNKDGKVNRKEMLVGVKIKQNGKRSDPYMIWTINLRGIENFFYLTQTYIDPRNPRHGKKEAETLIGLADADGDGRLTLQEMFDKTDLFLRSKMIDTAGNFHDEF